MDFTGKVVLVTGGSRGIGRAVAEQLAAKGATVAVHCRANRAAADETVAALGDAPHLVVEADLSDAAQIHPMVDTVVGALGRIDILVNNAGIYEAHPIIDTSYDDWQLAWQRTLATNLLGPAYLIHAVVPHMIAAGGGRIVNVSSRGAFRGEPDHPAYGASKAGLNSMGQSLARALGPHGIAVMTVAPGYVETAMAARHLDGPEGDEIRAQSPLGRVATAEEVAYVVAFLASEAAEFTTGTIVDVNGASYLRT
jgi:3-oxoacyl-[acyl-carrier protein] reductase